MQVGGRGSSHAPEFGRHGGGYGEASYTIKTPADQQSPFVYCPRDPLPPSHLGTKKS